MKITAIKTRIFLEGEDLITFIVGRIPKIQECSIVVITSKVVALSEYRTAKNINKEQLIKNESQRAIKTKHTWLTIKDGMFAANAGIDESNANGKLILLPKDSFQTAENLLVRLKKIYQIKCLGILITDSRTTPLRAGVMGVALGYAGFGGLRDYRGREDIFGRKLKITQTNLADSLATTATLIMGEGAEQTPLGIIEHPPVDFLRKTAPGELKIPIEDDMYRPFLVI